MLRKLPSSGLILLVASGHILIGLVIWTVWLATQNERWIRYFFDYQSAVFFVGFAALELYLGVVSWLQFSRGEPLWPAWFLIVIGSTYRLTGLAIAHIFGVNSYINPLVSLFDVQKSRQLGLAISGPVQMIMLACGLFLVICAYKQLGLAPRLKAIDKVLLTMVVVYSLRQGYEITQSLGLSADPITPYHVLNWVTDPLLGILLFEAIVLKRYVITMGWGLVGKCWGAFAAAIFATSLGNMGIWATTNQYLPWPVSSITWYIWFVASAAFALGPAYQVEATLRAKEQIDCYRKDTFKVAASGGRAH